MRSIAVDALTSNGFVSRVTHNDGKTYIRLNTVGVTYNMHNLGILISAQESLCRVSLVYVYK